MSSVTIWFTAIITKPPLAWLLLTKKDSETCFVIYNLGLNKNKWLKFYFPTLAVN